MNDCIVTGFVSPLNSSLSSSCFSVSLLNGVLSTRSGGRTKWCGMTVSASEEPNSSFNVERKRFMAWSSCFVFL